MDKFTIVIFMLECNLSSNVVRKIIYVFKIQYVVFGVNLEKSAKKSLFGSFLEMVGESGEVRTC